MSYDIMYDKLFVKLSEDQFVPMVLVGSNNCYYNSQDRKRVRDWCLVSYMLRDGNPFASREQILAALNTIEEGDGIAVYGKKCGGMLKDILNFYKHGMKCAFTIEQLATRSVTLSAKCKLGEDDFELIELLSTEHANKIISSREIIDVELNNRLSMGDMRFLRRKIFPRKQNEHQLIKVDHFYAICGTFGYFVKKTGRGFRHTSYWQGAKQFMYKKDAEKYIKRYNLLDGWYKQYRCAAERVDHEATFKVYEGSKEWKHLQKNQNKS